MNRPLPDVKTLPQWAQIYIRRLEAKVYALEVEKAQERDRYVSTEEEVVLLKEKISRLETTVRTLKEIGYED